MNIKDILSNYKIKDMSDYIEKNKTKDISKIKIEKATNSRYISTIISSKKIYYNVKMLVKKMLFTIFLGLC